MIPSRFSGLQRGYSPTSFHSHGFLLVSRDKMRMLWPIPFPPLQQCCEPSALPQSQLINLNDRHGSS